MVVVFDVNGFTGTPQDYLTIYIASYYLWYSYFSEIECTILPSAIMLPVLKFVCYLYVRDTFFY